MQTASFNTANLSPQVQSILPILKNLNIEERFSVIGFLANPQKDSTVSDKKNEPTIAQKRYGRYRGQIQILDGFDDDLGDEFWLGKDA